ncbi:hypothetical protein EYF80_033915 [Liparis tanakae]|uniref:Uncharacterized protein n=1 Tax=Liparis tanakae TaxID=230148 RepID=A0A4Z2GQI9_9TELE|nr:hypothetical protein EYF80_033915 [Liparis tanakae]
MSLFLTAFSNRTLTLPFTVSSSKPAETSRVVDGVGGLSGAAVERLHLDRLDLSAGLQVEGLEVAGEEGDDVGRGRRCLGDVRESCDGNNNELGTKDAAKRVEETSRPRGTIPLPLASEQTPRKPSSVRNLNSGRTPYVSRPRKTFLLAVSSRMKANTPSRREAIFWTPKRSYRWSKISPSILSHRKGNFVMRSGCMPCSWSTTASRWKPKQQLVKPLTFSKRKASGPRWAMRMALVHCTDRHSSLPNSAQIPHMAQLWRRGDTVGLG